jgi:pimeloyl-ACP methyl ester carboxylesterase
VQALLPAACACSIDVVPGTGHLVHEERPAEVARLMRAALDIRRADHAVPA